MAANAQPDPYLADQYRQVQGANQGVILEIRRIELVMKNFRWDDLMRWKEGRLLTEPFRGMYFPGPGGYDLDRDGSTDVVIYEGTKPTEKGPQYLKLGSEIDLQNGKSGGSILINRNIRKSFDEDKHYLYPIPIQEAATQPGTHAEPRLERRAVVTVQASKQEVIGAWRPALQ